MYLHLINRSRNAKSEKVWKGLRGTVRLLISKQLKTSLGKLLPYSNT